MLSIILICKDEACHISRCLDSVNWADEIIVLDSGSTDETVALCRQYTEKVFETDWPGFGIQKQRALDKASGDWVLSIDADEVVSAELRLEIEQAMTMEAVNGFEIPRLSSYCGKQILHGGWWPDHVLRLFRRDHGHFTEAMVHERVIVSGATKRLMSPILHEAFVDSSEVLHKVNSYSALGAKMLYAKGVRTSIGKAVAKAFWTFFRTWILKRGFLDGRQGIMLAISNAEGTYYKHIKLLELQDQSSVPQ
jgi:glycosyltransferase involved in cell wall biosynthesis